MDAYDKARDLFYPESESGRFWGGYAGWFEPDISGRTASPLIRHISNGLNDCDVAELRAAIGMLQSEHTKFLSKQGRGQEDVQCVPTVEGLKRADALKAVIEEIESC